MSDYKIKHLHGAILTPEVVLHRTIEKLQYIKSICVVIEWDDETHSMDWSSQKLATLSMARLTIENEILELIKAKKNE